MNDLTKEGLLHLSYKSDVDRSVCKTANPDWLPIEEGMNKIFQHGGFLKLENRAANSGYIYHIGIDSLGGQFRIVLLTNSDDPQNDIMEWWEPEDLPFRGKTLFGDDAWDNRTVCTDISTAYKILKEYHAKMDLIENLENMRYTWNKKP
ncbi:hypothetical protein QCD60_26770 [Pokkaliibacter sp. MBI-7]|uniref:DUF6911 family protein n=1 Tax=Pokkaliibacter sp. MBI-7 TaxID=3040600 RepID=UPI002449CAF5|nr:hypothetical protein [Pokkaliibacter sp. MBI-7]MDH2436139.1 hypothetical protein [Pokkaliibacter sp. MBI-7]